MTLFSEKPLNEAQNRAGTDLEYVAYWKFLDSKGPEIDESSMEVDGIDDQQLLKKNTTELLHTVKKKQF